jgi:alkylated DNA repair dioxygenase AlkB
MKLSHEKDKEKTAKILLKKGSLYVMRNVSRYDYAHEILKESESTFNGIKIPRKRRISVICRNNATAPQ